MAVEIIDSPHFSSKMVDKWGKREAEMKVDIPAQVHQGKINKN
jgi:hypothetical protein